MRDPLPTKKQAKAALAADLGLCTASVSIAGGSDGYPGMPRTILRANGDAEHVGTSKCLADPPNLVGFSSAPITNTRRMGTMRSIRQTAAENCDQIEKLNGTDAYEDLAAQAPEITETGASQAMGSLVLLRGPSHAI